MSPLGEPYSSFFGQFKGTLTGYTRLEITQFEVPISDIQALGSMIEDIFLHKIPRQSHPRLNVVLTTASPIVASPLKRKTLQDITPPIDEPSEKRIKEESIDTIMNDR